MLRALVEGSRALPKQGVDGALGEIMTADGVLADNIKASQEQFPKAASFFRPPYRAFTSLGASNIQTINDRGAAKYVGPIFWEIGGELTDKYSADWACWGKVDIARCAQGYIAEAELRGKGLVLVHDVHAKTVDMLKGTAARRSTAARRARSRRRRVSASSTRAS